MKKKTAVFGVSYPGVEPYIHDFLNSLSTQTDRDFVLFLLNDGLSNIDGILEGINFPIQVIERTGNPAELRKIGLQWIASEGAEVIVFADTDDYFADTRVEISKKYLVDYDVVCNELLLVGENILQPIPMLGEFLEDRMEIAAKNIMNGNCLGLSNSSIRVDKISSLISAIPDDVVAFDWDFFALCIHDGARAIFTKNTETYYRQHGGNIASPRSFSDKKILRGVRVKRDHYCLLSKFYNEYVKLANKFTGLYSLLESDDLLKENYCKAVRVNVINSSRWWEPIKTLEELEL